MTAPLLPSSEAKLVTVFGGSGFLGRQVVRALARRGWRIRVACRRPDLAGQNQPSGAVGQIMGVQVNIRRDHRWSIDRALEGADAAINLVGILAPTGKQSFADVQADGAHMIAEAAKSAGIPSMVHVSAIGADEASTSEYARTKALGEGAVLHVLPDSVVLRPSVLFGPDDDFFNKLGLMASLSPILPLIGGGKTRFQPAYVRDVAEAVAIAVEGGAKAGTTYELGGPEVKTFRECLELVCATAHRKRLMVPVPFGLAKLKAKVLQLLPNPLLTEDQVELLKTDNVVSEAAVAEGRTFAGLGIEPTAIEAVLEGYLWRFRPTGQFDRRAA
ncbi:complex I NDUFA9 subunit family protein [Pinisolibacter aquiterrae]|uniref:complex I NDUFA9 subunit family protein n=1 Tax=Pinisolibacter aquiterrae TaxID=2815579 RepID=UPI001C3E4A61|nr:complex I NDUFA9 subunit family protein [Pinisolibacter aquiterrae]MBV5262857.1 complex I NDUFA9 subunit family protein [Pinisolibacter aquiterrae]MCC8236429.1 complex I NDUFA9 subunit family protein [Pinisolibacter aquiterrae]